MITIIDPKPHKSVVKEAICRNCGVTIAYTPNEVREDYSTDYTGGKDYYNYVVCPACSHQIHT